MVNPGTPLGMHKTVSPGGVSDGGGSNPLLGYSIVKADSMDAGLYERSFDASDLASGLYFYQLRAVDFTGLKKMILLK